METHKLRIKIDGKIITTVEQSKPFKKVEVVQVYDKPEDDIPVCDYEF